MKLLFCLVLLFNHSSVFAKRLAPKAVKPVTHAGLRYEVPHWAMDYPKMKHNGGYIRVINARNNLPICLKEIYEVKYDNNMEQDVQDNFITKVSIKGKNLIIDSEKTAPITKPIESFCD